MKSKKIIIIVLIIILIILIGIALAILKKIKPETEQPEIQSENNIILNQENELSNNEILQLVSDRNEFYTAKNCIEKYYTYITNNGENIDQSFYEPSMNMLDKNYIKTREITKENIASKIPTIKLSIVNINQMLVSKQSNNISIYIVEGTLREQMTGNIINFKNIVKVDYNNETFSICPQDYVKEEWKIGNKIDIEKVEKIEKNIYNMYDRQNISDETYAQDLLNKYKEEAIYQREQAFEHLDEEYRNKKFGTLENFKIYATNNITTYIGLEARQFQKKKRDNYTQYVCIDQYGNYYIFKEKTIMNYDLILDTYTVDLPEFLEKYNIATDTEKVELNIQKIVEAINKEDYHYVYSKLDQDFKNNYYPTEESLKTFIQENLYQQNSVTYEKSEKTEDVYIYYLNIKNKENINSETKSIQLIMQLKEGTDFVISFSKI